METGEFPSQRPVTPSFDVFYDLLLNKRLIKQSGRRWFETPSGCLWRHCNKMLHKWGREVSSFAQTELFNTHMEMCIKSVVEDETMFIAQKEILYLRTAIWHRSNFELFIHCFLFPIYLYSSFADTISMTKFTKLVSYLSTHTKLDRHFISKNWMLLSVKFVLQSARLNKSWWQGRSLQTEINWDYGIA